MALVLDGRLVFLCHPRTASHAVTRALGRTWGARQIGQHHDSVEAEFLAASTLRRPAEVVLSWAAYIDREPLRCAEEIDESIIQREGRLFFHVDFSNVLLCYDRLQNDFDDLCDITQLTRRQLQVVNPGKWMEEPPGLDGACRKMWPDDYEIWDAVKSNEELYDNERLC